MSDIEDTNGAFGREPASDAPREGLPRVDASETLLNRPEPSASDAEGGPATVRDERPAAPPRLNLVPWTSFAGASQKTKAAAAAAWRWPLDPLGVAASVAAIGFVLVGSLAGYAHLRQSATVAVAQNESQNQINASGDEISQMKARIDALEATRSLEQGAEIKKTLAEIKSSVAASQSANQALGQLGQRVDRLEKEQSARLDKLVDHLDQSLSTRFADVTTRLDKLEKKPASVAAIAPTPPTPAQTAKLAVPPTPPNVSNEITGSIEKPKPALRGYVLEDIRDGMALIDTREGAYSVAPGDVLPGAGRVLKIERRGRDWVVVTTLGVVTTPQDPYREP